MPGPQAIVEAYRDPAAAMVALLREPASGRPSLAVVPLTPWAGQDPTVLAAALLNATSDLPVILAAPHIPEAWREWVAQHPASPRLMVMSLPLDLNALRLLGAAVARSRQSGSPAISLLAAPADSACLATLTNELRHSEERFAAAFRATPCPQAILKARPSRPSVRVSPVTACFDMV